MNEKYRGEKKPPQKKNAQDKTVEKHIADNIFKGA